MPRQNTTRDEERAAREQAREENNRARQALEETLARGRALAADLAAARADVEAQAPRPELTGRQ